MNIGFYRFGVIYAGIGCCAVLMTSCNPEKAKALQGVAVQFQAESLAAIEAIADMHGQELAPVKRQDTMVKQEFIQNILGYDATLDSDIVELAIAPYDVEKSPEVEARWQAFLDQLRSQYSTFSSIYDSVQTGVVPAADAVAESTAIAKKLTAQLSAFAAILDENPPMLIQHRSATLTDLETHRQNYQKLHGEQAEKTQQLAALDTQISSTQAKLQALPPAVITTTAEGTTLPDPHQATRAQLSRQQTTLQTQKNDLQIQIDQLALQKSEIEAQTGELMEQWQTIRATENQLLEDTVRQCLKAAALGQELIKLGESYDQFSMPTLNGAIAGILQKSTTLNTLSFIDLDSKADSLFSTLQTAPTWQAIANDSLSQVTNLLQDQTPENKALPFDLESLTDPNATLFQLPQ